MLTENGERARRAQCCEPAGPDIGSSICSCRRGTWVRFTSAEVMEEDEGSGLRRKLTASVSG